MEDVKIEPALTAEEWVTLLHPSAKLWKTRLDLSEKKFEEAEHHGLAAISLYGQPFGFTREDVELLERIGWEGNFEDVFLDGEAQDRLRSITERIKALLPPTP